MSADDFQKFMGSIRTDEAVQAALAERLQDGGSIPADDLIALAGEHGYAFNVEEAEDGLSDAALEGVAGGVSYLKIGDIKGESFATQGLNFEEVKVTYMPKTGSFNFEKIDY